MDLLTITTRTAVRFGLRIAMAIWCAALPALPAAAVEEIPPPPPPSNCCCCDDAPVVPRGCSGANDACRTDTACARCPVGSGTVTFLGTGWDHPDPPHLQGRIGSESMRTLDAFYAPPDPPPWPDFLS